MIQHANDSQTGKPRNLEPVRLGALSQELRAPLVDALKNLERLRGMRLNPKQRTVLDVAWSSVISARSLLDTLADFAPREGGAGSPVISVFPLAPMVEAVAATVSPLAHERGLHLDCAVEDAVAGRVEGDPTRLHQLLTTLAGHVIRASAGPTVSIRVRRHFHDEDGRRICFQIGTPRTAHTGASLDAVIGPASWGLCERLAATLGGDIRRHGEGESGFTVFCSVSVGRPGTFCNEREQARRPLSRLRCNHGSVDDLSLTGMRMTCRRSRGGRVRVKMIHGDTRVRCRARVIWTRKIADDAYEHGLCFVKMKPGKAAAIHRLSELG